MTQIASSPGIMTGRRTRDPNVYSTIPHRSPTVLSENTASIVTAASLATRLSLRFSSFFLDSLLGTAKHGAAFSIGTSRQILTEAFTMASRLPGFIDVDTTSDEWGCIQAFEKCATFGTTFIHHMFTVTELFAISGLELTSSTVQSGIKVIEETFRIVDGILGANQTSRAVSAIFALAHREIALDPDFPLAKKGKMAVMIGLTKALVVFAALQNITSKYRQMKTTFLWQFIVVDDKGDTDHFHLEANMTHIPDARRDVLATGAMGHEIADEMASPIGPATPSLSQASSIHDAPGSPDTAAMDYSVHYLPSQTHLPAIERRTESLPPHTQYYPRRHLIDNIARFMRFAGAAYGESFMRMFGIGDIPSVVSGSHNHHTNHHVFARHTGVDVNDILLSSYTDRTAFDMNHPSIHELVHYVTVDHASKAIVLTCRGTLGLSDILTDLTCSYIDIDLEHTSGGSFKVHHGIFEAALMLAHWQGKVFRTLLEGLERYPTYGLVLCGHSLGGGVASLLGVLWSMPTDNSEQCRFVTSPSSGLPAGRPIHCYVYGSAACMSLDLSMYCGRGLVTSLVHGNDFVPCLSLGVLQDFKRLAANLHEKGPIGEELFQHMVSTVFSGLESGVDNDPVNTQEEPRLQTIIKAMRADMSAEKLYPPSTVYLITSAPQTAALGNERSQAGTRVITLCRCENIKARFSELIFSRTMFGDHMPNEYEDAIRLLHRGHTAQSSVHGNGNGNV